MTIVRTRPITMAIVLALMLTLLGAAAPDHARADHCEPTEPVVRVVRPGYEEPGSEYDNPLCYVLLNYVYPRVCDNPNTLLLSCLNSLNPDPQEPVVVYPYNPDIGRMYCSYVNFAQTTLGQSGTCAS